MRRFCLLVNLLLLSALCLAMTAPVRGQIKTWRVGAEDHPWELSPVTGRLEWGRGWACELVDDDEHRFAEGIPPQGTTVWLAPIRLDSTRNLAVELNYRYLRGELGGLVPGRDIARPHMVVPSESGYRNETADPISPDRFGQGLIGRMDYGRMADGDPFTAFGSAERTDWGVAVNLKGFYYITRFGFGPRPTLPTATFTDFIIYYGDQTTIDPRQERLQAWKVLVPEVRGQSNPAFKVFDFDPPVIMGRVDLLNRRHDDTRLEIAETHLYGDGFPLDARYTSEMIDVGLPTPRVRRYSREIEQFSNAERNLFEQEFPELPGATVNWGRVRWRGRRLGDPGSNADVRLQFRTGNSPDTHLYARRLGADLIDYRDTDGNLLDLFSWIKLTSGRVAEKDLPYNELGADLGPDRRLGWSYWSAPFRFDEGLIPEDLPPEEWSTVGVPLPLPGGTRYLQFRILFDSEQHASTMFDFIEFEYAAPLVSGGVQAEIYPAEAPLGEERIFHYYLRPFFAAGETTQFNRLEVEVPSLDSRIDNLKFDGQLWEEIAAGAGDDPLLDVDPRFTDGGRGQFAQVTLQDPRTGNPKLFVKLPPLDASLFRFDEILEFTFTARLFRGSHQFSSFVWNDRVSERASTIPQPVDPGDINPDVATDGLSIVAERIGKVTQAAQVGPNPFTPNGDGINDEIHFTFDLLLVLEQTGIELEIFDLSGQMVYRNRIEEPAGRVKLSWDGRNQAGQPTPPGLYLYRLKIDSDAASREQTGLVSLVY